MNNEEKLKIKAIQYFKFYGVSWLISVIYTYFKAFNNVEGSLIIYIFLVYLYAATAFLAFISNYEITKTFYGVDNSLSRYLKTIKVIIFTVISIFLHCIVTILAFHEVLL